ncbi:MAG: hypothetical protein IKN80_00905 [Clostridiales bacterium]|nr:hypothetical protein [Clostridiales bacterium]
MKWFKEMRKGQKVLFLINVVLTAALFVLSYTGYGRQELFGIGIIMGLINIYSIVFARAGFKFGIAINVDNAGDDVEPSELKYMDWYMKWGFYTLIVIACAVCAFVFA